MGKSPHTGLQLALLLCRWWAGVLCSGELSYQMPQKPVPKRHMNKQMVLAGVCVRMTCSAERVQQVMDRFIYVLICPFYVADIFIRMAILEP